MGMLKKSDNKILKILYLTIENFKKHSISEKAVSITYFVILSLGPLLILIFSLLSNFLSNNIDALVDFFVKIFPESKIYIEPILEYISSSNYNTFAIVSGITTLYAASKGTTTLMNSLDDIFEINQEGKIKNKILNILQSMLFTLAITLAVLLFFVFFINGNPIGIAVKFLFGIDLSKIAIWKIVNIVLPVIYLIIFLSLLYKIFPNFSKETKIDFKISIIGAIFSSTGWIIGSLLFSYYIQNINKNNAIYGVLGSLMALMLWINLLMNMLLLGACLIKAINDFNGKKHSRLLSLINENYNYLKKQ